MQVWTCLIHHRHGTNVTVHTTEAGAHDEALAYVDQEWAGEIGERPTPDGMLPEERIDYYFEHVEGEWCDIEETRLDADAPLHTLDNWANDAIQFPRLLAELRSFGLTTPQYTFLRESMDLSMARVDEVLERAETEWQKIKERT